MVTQTPKNTLASGLKKSNAQAMKYLMLPFFFLAAMISTLNEGGVNYWAGQLLGAIFFAQAFILLHETGHRSFFKSNKLNSFFGHFFSLFVFIPYYNWLEIHDLHHKWTGWRDKDPTTEKTFEDRLSSFQTNLINFCWKFYIPLFSIGYRLGIYWKAEKLKRHLPTGNYKRCIKEMYLYGGFYLITIFLFPGFYLSVLPAILLSFVITDIITLSQHSHIEMPISNGEDVNPLKFKDQAKYSRSLIFPSFVSEFILFNFNFHENHHIYPGLPCYHLNKLSEQHTNSFPFLPWLKKVKSMDGVSFIFRTSSKRDGF